MCEACLGSGLSRRGFLAMSAAGLAAVAVGEAPVLASPSPSEFGVPIGSGYEILGRDVWGADLAPTGPLPVEDPGDVRFLLLHHTASPNGYSPDRSAGLLRSIYAFHTSAEKGWSDIAYNFLVDEHGQIFEGRAGSVTSPVRGDATGGSQGFAMLCCFIGDHTEVPPTAAAQQAMVALLSWLASTYGIDTTPGATAQFVSRGSGRHPAGVSVTTPTITGHRNMSLTICPGDAAFALVEEVFPAWVSSGVRPDGAAPLRPEVTTTALPTTVPPTTVVSEEVVSTSEPTTSLSTRHPDVSEGAGGGEMARGTGPSSSGILGAVAAVGAALAGVVWWRWRRTDTASDVAPDG
ncbi:MAG: N-acetylmuramoyl-L-alanine amidase [Actinomycetota bacterium]|jgi:hypothetical protein|nr:N-acetylmuramoyl-L-alanine amidase [Actinomycetota bacterium]